ncbi:DegT/DnrJ/EryC1/StrS family aminotransferase [Paralcaligenes ginsengisoli]
MSNFLPYALPEIGPEEIAEVVDSLKSGWVTSGPKTRRFEHEFAAFLGDDSLDSIAVNSATAGLHLALEALGVGPGDEIITTTLTFTATAEVARYMGADVRLVDIDPTTLNMDVNALRAAISPTTKAILPVHYGGLACDMEAIINVAREYNLLVIEDAAHALPSYYNGKLIGTLDTDATVFSFYANKTMTTGEGGMVVTRNKEAAARMRIMRLHGISRDAFDRFVSKTPAWYYEIVAPGFKYNMTDIAAAMGIHQLAKLSRFCERRQELAQRYLSALKPLPLVLPATAPSAGQHAWHLFVVRVSEGSTKTRDDVINYLSEQGIGTSVHYLPLHRQPYWRDRYQLKAADFPEADQAYHTMLSLPLYTAMNNEDQTRVINALTQCLT